MPGRGLGNFIKDRLLSFALIVGIGFLLLVSLVLSAGLSAMDKFMVMSVPAHETLWQGINFLLSFGVIALLFAMTSEYCPM